MEQGGTGWNKVEQGWNRGGTGWNKVEQGGTGVEQGGTGVEEGETVELIASCQFGIYADLSKEIIPVGQM